MMWFTALQLSQRLETWRAGWGLSWEHPWIGHGWDPVELSVGLERLGAPLWELHSDWLALAYAAGWPAVVLGAWTVGRLVSLPTQTKLHGLCQFLLGGLSCWALVKSTWWHPGFGLAWVVALGGCACRGRGEHDP